MMNGTLAKTKKSFSRQNSGTVDHNVKSIVKFHSNVRVKEKYIATKGFDENNYL
jgi:hypothetical protein